MVDFEAITSGQKRGMDSVKSGENGGQSRRVDAFSRFAGLYPPRHL